jgi:hypothetical protein
VLRAEAGEASKELARFWTEIQRVPLDELPDAFRHAPRPPREGGRGQGGRGPGGGRAPQGAPIDEASHAAPGGELGPDGAPFKKKRRRRGGRGRRRKPGAPPSSGPAE